MQDQQTTLNGVDTQRLFGTVEAISETPELARFQFRARNTWVHGGHNRSTIKEFYGAGQEDTSRVEPFVYDNDEPDVLLGTDRGANPVEYVLHALAGCLTTTLVYNAAALGIPLEKVESIYEGDLDLRGFLGLSDDVRSGFEEIRVKFELTGDLTDEQLEQLVAAQQRSPVFDIVSNAVPVQIAHETKPA
jgi:uncharacterized OsmC-like protein